MSVKIDGIRQIKRKLENNTDMEAVKSIVKQNGAMLQLRAQRNAPVDTGNLKRSIGLEIRDGGLTAESEAKAEYGPYVEYGTRYMEAQPYMRPAFLEQKEQFRKDINRLVR